MREIARTALVPYSPAQMFALVDDFARYPEFLPWVSGAELVEKSGDERIGRLQISRAGLNEQITTRNLVKPPNRLEMKLLDGPFRLLEGVWTFDAIAGQTAGSSSQASGTRIGLTFRFEFKNRMMDMLLAPKFAASCDTLVDAFAKRARDVYGAVAP
jgi:ribosome-associated toxin RatA of RatAB toxin-antitoxin module